MNTDYLKKLAAYALERLKAAGADEAQCKVSFGSSSEVNIDSDEFSLLRTIFNSSVILTAYKNKRKGTVAINKTEREAIDAAALDCIENALASDEDDCLSIAPLCENEDFSFGIETPDMDLFFDRIEEYMRDLKKDYPLVSMEQLIADFSYGETCFANTNGVCFTRKGGYYSLGSMYSAHDGDKTTSFNNYGVDFSGLDKKLIDVGMQRMMYDMCQKELEASVFDGKFTGTAVFAPSCVTDIIGAAIDEFTSDSPIIDGTSPWRDSLGQQIASEILNVSLIPIDDRIIGGERFTSEGYRTENCELISDGVLNSFTLSEYAARKSGEKRCSTLSSCMEIKAGATPYDELISGIKTGILVGRLSGGSPASNGDFSAVAKNSFLIEDGKITRPVLETMISGNLAEMLKNISSISCETVADGSSVLPWVAFDGVTVSGKNTSDSED